MEWTFFQRENADDQQARAKILNVLIIKEIQIKTTVRYHLTPVRMTLNERTWIKKLWREYGEKEILVHCWWECKLVKPLWKAVWNLLKKLKIEQPYDLAIQLLGIYPKNLKHYLGELHAIAALVTIAKVLKQLKFPLALRRKISW